MYRQRIREIYGQLSPGYRRIADFLLNSYQDAAFMTAAQVGKASDVDTTLVVRFAQRLGYPGFPELIDEIQADVKRDLQAVYESAPDDNTPVGVLRRTLIHDRNNLQYVLLQMNPAAIEKAIDLLSTAPRVFVTGDGASQSLVQLFAWRLLVLGTATHVVASEISGPAAIAVGVKPGDVYVGVGTTPLALGVAAVITLARRAGAHTIGIVDSPANPVAAAAEHMIVAPVRSVGMLPSWTAPAAVLHGLAEGLSVGRVESTKDWVMQSTLRMQEYVEVLEKGIGLMTDVMKEWYSASSNQE